MQTRYIEASGNAILLVNNAVEREVVRVVITSYSYVETGTFYEIQNIQSMLWTGE